MSQVSNLDLIFLGPPGAGKGTQARKISAKYNIPQISTGDLMRASVLSGTPIGKKLKKYMSSGVLVPDELVLEILLDRLEESDCQYGFVLDGFPRTVPQAETLANALIKKKSPISAVISIEVPDEDITKRLTARRNCKCGASYHLEFLKPKVEGVCDYCGKKLFQRKDDTKEVIENRLCIYHKQTAPLIDFYQKQKNLYPVDGKKKIEMIFSEICDIINKLDSL